jgi:NAD-dependent deacetylase
LYDEQIDYKNIENAKEALRNADTVVIVGTSFKVYPFAALIDFANGSADIYAINKERVQAPFMKDSFIGDAVAVFEEL